MEGEFREQEAETADGAHDEEDEHHGTIPGVGARKVRATSVASVADLKEPAEQRAFAALRTARLQSSDYGIGRHLSALGYWRRHAPHDDGFEAEPNRNLHAPSFCFLNAQW
jgi:hypothetical protein